MSNRNFLVKLAVFATVLIGAASDLRAADRVALVIGNGDYVNAKSLPNPTNDATDMAAELQRLGFSVIQVLNGTYGNIGQAIRKFNIQVEGAQIGLIYFSGHGMELGGENWLIPVDADLKTDLDLANEAINLKTLMQSASRASGLGLIILDACRDNPFAAHMARSKLTRSVERGFARVEPTSNVLVAYSAKDGTTASDGDGRNSPYTAALLRNLERPGLEVSYVFRNVRDEVMASTGREQQPFVYGSLSSKLVYLNEETAPSAASSDAKGGGSADEMVWQAIKGAKDPQLLEDFLTKFPDSAHQAEARNRLAGLKVASECDRLASLDIDRGRNVTVTHGDPVVAEASTDPCAQAMQRFPDDARFVFQAGRIAEGQKNYGDARRLYEKAGGLGSAPAMLRLGLLYSEGRGVPADYAQARQWFDKAVQQNLPAAMLDLGVLYESGQGGSQDYRKAYELYSKAAAAGDRHAMKNLGSLYETGRGVGRDYDEARRWYQKSADLGDWTAMTSLGKLYERGLGVRKSAAEAQAWYKKAASAEDAAKKTVDATH